MEDKDKHKVPLNLHTLHETPLSAPRRKLWDFVPEFLALWLLRKGFNPQPTPFELWVVHSVALRAYYSRFFRVVDLLNQQSQATYDIYLPKDISELN